MDVRQVAKLAHLEISDAEVELYTPQMADIVKYIEQLNELDTNEIEPMLGGLTREGQATVTIREDVPGGSLGQEAALDQAPSAGRGTFSGSKGFVKTVVNGQWSVISTWHGFICCLLLSALCQLACSLPNLEKPECTAARDAVKRFYSFHFGNDMHPLAENLTARESFLSADLMRELRSSSETGRDYFTATDNYPKAFRVGTCSLETEHKALFQVLLFWRDDTKSEQKEVKVEAVKTGDKWLINKVFN